MDQSIKIYEFKTKIIKTCEFSIGNKFKMNAWVHLEFTYLLCIFGKLDLFFKVAISLKLEFYEMYLRKKNFKIGILIYLKTLPKC